MTELPATCDAELLMELTGLNQRTLYRFSEQDIIPKPDVGDWPTVETLQRLFAHWRNKGDQRTSLGEEKLKKAIADRRIAEAEASKAEHNTLSRRQVEKAWEFMLMAARARWIQMPPKAGLAFPTWADARACEAWTEEQVIELLEEFSRAPDYNIKDEDSTEAELVLIESKT